MRLLKRKTRKQESSGKLELDRVIGLTTASANGLSCNVATGDLAYLAGCVVVVYNVKANNQTRFLMAPKSSRAFSCVSYSTQGGKFLAAGELGHQPGVIVWEVSTGSCVADMRTHKYGICSVQFSPNGKHIVSIGVPHDGHICLWDWKSGTLLAKSRASTSSLPACSMQFASDGSFFVTGGAKHMKHWIIGLPRARSAGGNGTIGMEGKSVKLGSQKDSSFVSILCAPLSKDPTTVTSDFQPLYALTTGGVLCLLHCGSAIEKWVDLKVRHGFALAVSQVHVGCACSDGIIRIFMHASLAYAVTLPRPAPYGYHGLTDASIGASLAVGQVQPGIRFPDAVACSFFQEGQKLAVIYGDHSLFVWDVRNFLKIGRYRTFLSHSSCVWDVNILPTQHEAPALQLISDKDCLHGGAFATCSADGTIRLWYLASCQEGSSLDLNAAPSPRPANVYSKDILGVIYVDTRGEHKERPPIVATDEEPVDITHGFRSICASPDGQQLAAGDCSGNLRIFDLNTLELISFQEAHDGEILSLSFTSNTNDRLVEEPVCMPLLASGGRDRLIHIYDVNRDYDVVETLDDHSASVTTVKFACSGSKLLSCSADKSVVFRNVVASSAGCKCTRYHQEIASRGTIYDIDTEPSEKLAVAVGQDKKLNILNLSTGKTVRYIKGEADIGEPIKVRVDPSGMYVVCSHSDRCMRVYDFSSGELLAIAYGHSEVITGMTFLPDCRRIISVSGDSCIFLWRLPLNLSRSMRKHFIAKAESRPPPKCLKPVFPQSPKHMPRTSETAKSVNKVNPSNPLDMKVKDVCPCVYDEGSGHNFGEAANAFAATESNSLEVEMPQTEPRESNKLEAETPAGFKFSVSRLPPWAQAKVAVEDTASSDSKPASSGDIDSLQSFESRWAERFGRDGCKIFSESRRETAPPESIFATGCGIPSCYSTEAGDSAIMESAPPSLRSQTEGMPSIQGTGRSNPKWKTVHTLFLDEQDYSHDDSPARASNQDLATGQAESTKGATGVHFNGISDSSHTIEEKVTENVILETETRIQERYEAEGEDAVVANLSDDDPEVVPQESAGTGEEAKILEKKEDDKVVYSEMSGPTVTSDAKKDDGDRFDVSSRRTQSRGTFESFNPETMDHPQTSPCSPFDWKRQQAFEAECDRKRLSVLRSPKVSIRTESTKEDCGEGEGDDLRPHRDLFSANFNKLASNLKVEGSDKSSFSARFFARENPLVSQSPWFDTGSSPKVRRISQSGTQALLQDDDMENNPGRLLAAERERLKLRERQDKMAVEVQRMRERLVNLGIAVAEIAHEGETIDKIGEGDDKTSEYGHYVLPLKTSDLQILTIHAATDNEATCVLNLPTDRPAPENLVFKKASNSLLSGRDTDQTESLRSEKTSKGAISRLSCNREKESGSHGLDSIISSKLGTPLIPPHTATPRNLDGRKIDMWQSNVKEDPEGEGKHTFGENVGMRLSTDPQARLSEHSPLHMEEGMEDRKKTENGEGILGCLSMAAKTTKFLAYQVDRGDKGIEKQISGPDNVGASAKIVGSGMANRVDNKSVEERRVDEWGGNPCTRAVNSQERLVEMLPPERNKFQFEGNQIEGLPARAPAKAVGRGTTDMEVNNVEDLEERTKEQRKDRGLSEDSSNIEKKVDIHHKMTPSSCMFSPSRGARSSVQSGRPNTGKGESCYQDPLKQHQGVIQSSSAPELIERCERNVMTAFSGLSKTPPVEVQDRFLHSFSEPLEDEWLTTTPPLPRPIADYEKSLQDLMEAADRASSLFGEVRSICQKTSSPEVPVTPGTPSDLPPDILSLSRSYQRFLPGTLQTVQRLADEAAACGRPLECNMGVMSVEDSIIDDYNFGKIHDYGINILQSRPGTATSSTESLLASFDVEGFISRYSETLASQVLALVQKALPNKAR